MRSKSSKLSPSAAQATVQFQEPGAPNSGGHPSWFIGGVGLAFCALFIIGVMTQVQTNEALVLHSGDVQMYKPDWSLLAQPVQLVIGGLTSDEAAAVVVGWGIELIYLGFIVGFEIMQYAAGKSGQFMAKAFRFLSLGIIGLNMWTDAQYGTIGAGSWGHIVFALVTSLIVGFGGTIGMHLVEIAWKRS